MKKTIVISLLIISVLLVFSSCSPAFSEDYYEEISSYVKLNIDYIETNGELEYFMYNEVDETAVKSYYGYYYSKSGAREPYITDTMFIDKASVESGDGGYYYGEVSDEGDWCFIKSITSQWYYFESHDYIYN